MIGIFALGIGFSTALLLFIQSFLGGPVPGISRQESLVRIRGIDRTQPGHAIGREFSYPEYREYASQRALFSAVAAWTSYDIVFDVEPGGQATPQSGAATYVTAGYCQAVRAARSEPLSVRLGHRPLARDRWRTSHRGGGRERAAHRDPRPFSAGGGVRGWCGTARELDSRARRGAHRSARSAARGVARSTPGLCDALHLLRV